MTSLVSSLVAAAIILMGMGTAAAAQTPARAGAPVSDVSAGRRLAHALCTNCHVVDAGKSAPALTPAPSFPWIAKRHGATETSVTVWLSTSHPRMPNILLSDTEIRQLSAYIISLRK
jgi:mono/diheme cytochrome c family protein